MRRPLRILVNATTCVVGGGVQVATAFITQAIRNNKSIDFCFAASAQVIQNIDTGDRSKNRLHEIAPSPAKLIQGLASRKKLAVIEKQFSPDVVFTIFGPAYHNFRAPHICGFADPWVTHRSAAAMSVIAPLQRIRLLAICKYKEWQISRNDYYWVEAEVARRGLVRLGIPSTRIRVIPNSYASVFQKKLGGEYHDPMSKHVRIFCIAAPYPHKNLLIIPEVAKLLQNNDPHRVYRFVLTLPDDGPIVRQFWNIVDKYGVKDMIENAGILKLHECPRFYAESDILFLPTLLETFSATYPEAMVMTKPIVTTDLDFAHDICGDAAAYYSPFSAQDAARTIEKVASDTTYRESLIENGQKRLAFFPTPEEKYHQMITWITEVAALEKQG